MAVLSMTNWRVHPGRTAEFLQGAAQAKAIHERHGARVFLAQWQNAGTGTGLLGYGMLFADIQAWGGAVDALGGDQAWMSLVQQRIDAADAGATLASQSLLSDQPGFEATEPPSPGTFLLVSGGTLAPGRSAEEVLRVAHDWKNVSADLGAQWMRFRRTILGGEQSMRFTASYGFAGAAGYAAFIAKLADPGRQGLLQATFGPSSPLVNVSQASGRVLPL